MTARLLLLLPLVACYVLQQPPSLAVSWVTTPLVDSGVKMDVTLALKKQNMEQLRNLVDQVSNPQSPQYSQYLSNAEVHRLTAPSPVATSAVAVWLEQNNVRHTFSAGMDTVMLHMTAAEVERVFSTTVRVVRNVKTKQSALRAGAIHVPDTVAQHIQAVFGVHGLPLPPRPVLSSNPRRDVLVTPDTILKTYKVSGVTVSGGEKNRQAVAEFTQQWMNQDDLTSFFKQYVPNAKSGEDQVYKYVGDKQTGSGVEAMLDIEYIMGVAPGIKTEFWAVGSNNFCSDLKTWSDLILNATNGPNVHSVSYGEQGDIVGEPSCSEQEVAAVDENFQKIAATGVSIIFASGDSGSGWTEDIRCQYTQGFAYTGTPYKKLEANPSACCDACSKDKTCKAWTSTYAMPPAHANESTADVPPVQEHCKLYEKAGSQSHSDLSWSGTPTATPPPAVPLWPSWPASSPYVTAVGSTRFIGEKVGNPEMATDEFGSGGGFSWNWTAPAWQKDAIKTYFSTVDKSTLPTAGSYPPAGRATPDVSALGEGFQVVVAQATKTVGGTSAAAPTFAAIVSLLNEARIAKGKKALGLLNQWIYQNEAAFTDVTVGWDRFGRGPFRIPEGFNCTKGWDPVTGMGTPDFTKMLAAALAAP